MTTRAHSNRGHSKTTAGNNRPGNCSICQQPARRVKPDLYANVYDVDCEQCGKYRIGGSGEAAVRSMGNAGLGARWLRLIARANADGDRLTIPGEMRIPLTQ
jgi:hypothetical protein